MSKKYTRQEADQIATESRKEFRRQTDTLQEIVNQDPSMSDTATKHYEQLKHRQNNLEQHLEDNTP